MTGVEYDATNELQVDVRVEELFPYAGVDAGILHFGLERSWLSERDVVVFCLERYGRGVASSATIETIALLLPDEFNRVSELLEPEVGDGARPREFWLFFLHFLLLKQNTNTAQLWQQQEFLYSSFGYPAAIAQFSEAWRPMRLSDVAALFVGRKRRTQLSQKARQAHFALFQEFVERERMRFSSETSA
jgi:hypothetical protein